MKKFVSMVMAAAMIFALAAPAFAVKATTSTAVKATMTAPKVAMTAAKVSVVANPYRITIKDPTGANTDGIKSQIAMAPAAFINKSDTKLKVYFLVTPGTSNNVKFTDNVADGQVKDDANKPMPGAKIDVKFAKQAAYDAATVPSAFSDLAIPLYGATGKCKDDFTISTTAADNTSYSVFNTAGDALKPIEMDLATDLTVGNAIWVKVEGTLNTDVDWVNWKDGSNKAASIDFTIAVYCEPVANAA